MHPPRARRLLALLLFLLAAALPARPYSVQTHEQLVDLAWKPSIVPVLLARFPNLTPAELQQAHAYAYGGCAIQDIGYYPFGNQFFSNLTHYVRSGDFVRSLLRNARTPNELAFAIGALTHYIGDTYGHSVAVNPSVADDFPKLRRRFGPSVSYDESPHAHVRTEFAFDIDEIANHRFAPASYLAHVGLNVSRDLLARAFLETYGLPITSVLGGNRRPTFKGYEFSVRHFLPRIAYAENVLHRNRFPPDTPGAELDRLKAALAQSDFENGWEAYRKSPGIGTYTLAGLIYILPKAGPLALLAIKGPTPPTEDLYVRSVNASTAAMVRILVDIRANSAQTVLADIPNRDLDTGQPVRPGAYRLTDETYATLLDRLTRPGISRVSAGLRQNVLAFYADPNAPISTRNNPAAWARVQADLRLLAQVPTTPEP